MKRRVWGVLLILLMTCLSCSQVREYADIARDSHISEAYLSVLEKWTSETTVYREFETKVHIAMTYKGEEFNDAYSREYSRIHGLTEQERQTRAMLTRDLSADFDEFLFYAYIPENDSNDFAKSDSIWKIFLIDGSGAKTGPLEVRKFEKITPVIMEFFPYINPHYGMFYSLKFPAHEMVSGGTDMKIVFTSVIGRVEFEWDRKRGAEGE
jgi:hypothetical protein